MKLVVDASVAVKWVIRDPVIEPSTDQAVAILRAIRAHAIDVVQPPHWLLEVLGVIAQARPQRIALVLGIFATLPFKEVAQLTCYRRAADLAIQLNQHLFDTLYHAVALEEGATLVTADEGYFDKAKELGAIERLADFTA